MFGKEESGSIPQPMPLISDRTRDLLLEELGLDKSVSTQRVIAGITGEFVGPIETAMNFTQTVFSDVLSSNRAFLEGLNRPINENFVIAIYKDHVSWGWLLF